MLPELHFSQVVGEDRIFLAVLLRLSVLFEGENGQIDLSNRASRRIKP